MVLLSNKYMNKEQYIAGIKLLSPIQIEFLKTIYYNNKNHSATAKEIALTRRYRGYQGANAVIGAIGKKFAEIPGVELGTYYKGGEKSAYYELIGPWDNENGWEMNSGLISALEDSKIVSKNENISVEGLPTEIMDFEESELREGGFITVKVDRYERNGVARQKCIQHYGAFCQVCGFDFGKVYGKDADGFINVHHIIPLSEIGKEYRVDPIKDLIPLCSNCHSAVHLTKPPKSISEMKKLFGN